MTTQLEKRLERIEDALAKSEEMSDDELLARTREIIPDFPDPRTLSDADRDALRVMILASLETT